MTTGRPSDEAGISLLISLIVIAVVVVLLASLAWVQTDVEQLCRRVSLPQMSGRLRLDPHWRVQDTEAPDRPMGPGCLPFDMP